MENYKKCAKCQKFQIQSKFTKYKNGAQKKTCLLCCIKRKKILTEDDKIYLNLNKVHKQLYKKFQPIREREYRRKYASSHIPRSSRRCPVFNWCIRSCSHCKHPERYPIEIKTMENNKILLTSLLNTI